MNQIYKLDRELEELISHTLCLEQMVQYEGYICKDLSLLVQNRTVDLIKESEEDDMVASEIMVIDVVTSAECSDAHCVPFFI